MWRLAPFCVVFAIAFTLTMGTGRAHDLPGQVSVSGFFDDTGPRPEFLLRVPLILLTNVNLPKRGPGYLDLGNLGESIGRAEAAVVSGFRISAGGKMLEPLSISSRISQPSEGSFETLDSASAAVTAPPLPPGANVFWNQGFFDLRVTFAPQRQGSNYTLHADLPAGIGDRTLISLGIIEGDGAQRMLVTDGSTREVALDPSWYQAGFLFLTKGVEHILIGYDHLLFVICLILPLRTNIRRLFGVITAFTVGHSITLIPAALGYAPAAGWFLPLVETFIAISILYMAVENVLGVNFLVRWRLAFAFGLIHGFGFASTLTDVLQFAGSHLLTSLIFFNIGIEVGQVLVLAAVLPLLALLFRTRKLERAGVIVISALAGHEAWHWAAERAADIPIDPLASEAIFSVLTWTGLVLILVLALVWLRSLRAASRGPALSDERA